MKKTETVKQIAEKGYRIPEMSFVPSGERKLYNLENRAHEAQRDAFAELGRVLGLPDDFYKQALPEGLCAMLESYDTNAAILAAVVFLEHKGYEIKIA